MYCRYLDGNDYKIATLFRINTTWIIDPISACFSSSFGGIADEVTFGKCQWWSIFRSIFRTFKSIRFIHRTLCDRNVCKATNSCVSCYTCEVKPCLADLLLRNIKYIYISRHWDGVCSWCPSLATRTGLTCIVITVCVCGGGGGGSWYWPLFHEYFGFSSNRWVKVLFT